MASEVKSDRDHGAGDSNRIRNSHSDGDLRCGQYEGILYPDMTDKNQQQPEDVAAERPVTIAIAVNNSSQQRPTSMHRTLSNARDCIYEVSSVLHSHGYKVSEESLKICPYFQRILLDGQHSSAMKGQGRKRAYYLRPSPGYTETANNDDRSSYYGMVQPNSQGYDSGVQPSLHQNLNHSPAGSYMTECHPQVPAEWSGGYPNEQAINHKALNSEHPSYGTLAFPQDPFGETTTSAQAPKRPKTFRENDVRRDLHNQYDNNNNNNFIAYRSHSFPAVCGPHDYHQAPLQSLATSQNNVQGTYDSTPCFVGSPDTQYRPYAPDFQPSVPSDAGSPEDQNIPLPPRAPLPFPLGPPHPHQPNRRNASLQGLPNGDPENNSTDQAAQPPTTSIRKPRKYKLSNEQKREKVLEKLQSLDLKEKLSRVLSEKGKTLEELSSMSLNELRFFFRVADRRRAGSLNYQKQKSRQASKDGHEALESTDKAGRSDRSRGGEER